MDFMCDGCGKWHWISPESVTKQQAIANLEELLDNFEQNPWLIEWFDYHEPVLMRQLRNAVNSFFNKRD